MSEYEEVWDYEEDDLGLCPYNLRSYPNHPRHDPTGICDQMGICERAEEPQCQTCEPTEGWPSINEFVRDAGLT